MIVAAYALGIAILVANGPNKGTAQNERQGDSNSQPPITVNCNNVGSDQQSATNQKPQEPHTGIEWSNWVLVIITGLTGLAVFEQARASTRAARSAEKSATATQQNVDSLVNSERAWILVELRCPTHAMIALGSGNDSGTTTVMDVELHCFNHGSSPAWITEKSARLVNTRELDPTPALAKEDVITDIPVPVAPGQSSISKWSPTGEGHYSPMKSALIIYGMVKYRDIFQIDRETWFCYQLTGHQTHRAFIRVSAPPGYTKYT